MRQCTITLPVLSEEEDIAEVHAEFIEEVALKFGAVKAISGIAFYKGKEVIINEVKEVILENIDVFEYSFPVDELSDYSTFLSALLLKYKQKFKLKTLYIQYPNGIVAFV